MLTWSTGRLGTFGFNFKVLGRHGTSGLGFLDGFSIQPYNCFVFFSDSGVVTLYEVSSGVTPNRPVGQGWKIQK